MAALASDQYDARGQLYRAGFAYIAPSYDLPTPYTDMFGHYDLVAGSYSLTGYSAETDGMRQIKPLPRLMEFALLRQELSPHYGDLYLDRANVLSCHVEIAPASSAPGKTAVKKSS